MARRRHRRGWILFWALLQLAIPSAATYADALLERAGPRELIAHVESRTSASCRPVHPADCALCQIVLRVAAASTPACLPSIEVVVSASRETLAARPLTPARDWLPPPRAPPAV